MEDAVSHHQRQAPGVDPSPPGEGGSCQCSHSTRPRPWDMQAFDWPQSPHAPECRAPPKGSGSWFSSHSGPPGPAVTPQTHSAHTRMGPGPGVLEPECEPRRQAWPPAGQQALCQQEAPRATPHLHQPGPPGPCEPHQPLAHPGRAHTHTRNQTWPPPCWLWASHQGQQGIIHLLTGQQDTWGHLWGGSGEEGKPHTQTALTQDPGHTSLQKAEPKSNLKPQRADSTGTPEPVRPGMGTEGHPALPGPPPG